MRKLSADFILTPNKKLEPGHTLIIDDEGQIVELLPSTVSDAEYFKGILCPGFVNAHSHLELSHFKNKIQPHTGLEGFINDFVRSRKLDQSNPQQAIQFADEAMWENGIQAVGDICNNESAFQIKSKSKIRYHSFVEIFSMLSTEAASAFDSGIRLLNQALTVGRHASIVPHAPYSSSKQLFELLKNYHNSNPSKWCIHNQESEAENEMFKNATGKLIDMFQSKGIDMSWFTPEGVNSLPSMSRYFPNSSDVLLVHNTYTRKSDLQFLSDENRLKQVWFCLCPKANLFIENALPDLNLLKSYTNQITIGTDSYASNDTLSILEEIKVLHNAFPKITVAEILIYATINGARYFGWSDLGSFATGSNCGILNITEADSKSISATSEINRIF